MAISGVGPRLTLEEQASRNPQFRNRPLAVETRLPAAGDRLVRATDMAPLAKGRIENVTAAVLSRAVEIEIPEMIAISDKVSIMKYEVAVGLFKQIMEGYEITGGKVKDLRAILDDPSQAENALTYVNLYDAREFAKRLSERTGRKFRVQTEEEWLAAGNRLSGNNWTWTETRLIKNTCVLCHLGVDGRSRTYPEDRYNDIAIRLVEDISV